MISCVDTNSVEFKALLQHSGLSEFLLETLVANYQDRKQNEYRVKHGNLDNYKETYPRLDEIPTRWLDTKEAMQKFLDIDEQHKSKNGFLIDPKSLYTKLNVDNINDAVYKLNDIYRNLDIEASTVGDSILLDVAKRPSLFNPEYTEKVDTSNLQSSAFIAQTIQKLQAKFNMQVYEGTTASFKKKGIFNVIPDASTAAAFVYKGVIFINTDIMDARTSKVHELLHILLGSIKFSDPQTYANLTSVVEQLDNYQDLIQQYPNRARSDINEEIFVTEYAKLLTQSLDTENPAKYPVSLLANLNPEVLEALNYETTRVLDTILNGDESVGVIPANERFGATLVELGRAVNAHSMETVQDFIDSSIVHRLLANKRSELMEQGKLKETCD